MITDFNLSDLYNLYHYYFEESIDYLVRTYTIFEYNRLNRNEQVSIDYEKLTLITLRQLIINSDQNDVNFIKWINKSTNLIQKMNKDDLFLQERINTESFKYFKHFFLKALKRFNALFSESINKKNDYRVSELDKLIRFANKIVAHFSYLEVEKWEHTQEVFYDKKLLAEFVKVLYGISQSMIMLSSLEGCGDFDKNQFSDFDLPSY